MGSVCHLELQYYSAIFKKKKKKSQDGVSGITAVREQM